MASHGYFTRSQRNKSSEVYESWSININCVAKQNAVETLKKIGKQVKQLEIVEGDYDMKILQTVYQEVPAIECLTVLDWYMIQDVDILPRNLKKIIVDSEVSYDDLISLEKLLSNTSVKALECTVVRMKKTCISINRFMDDEVKYSLLSTLQLDVPIDIKTDFNFLDAKKMTFLNVLGLKFICEIRLLQPLLYFKNLQELDLDFSTTGFQSDEVFKNANFKLQHIKVLKLAGNMFFTCFQRLFQICSSINTLEMRNCRLRNVHFVQICENLIHLKKLYLYGKDTNCFTLDALMCVTLMYSLKDLGQLEELHIESNPYDFPEYQQQITQSRKQWPRLLNLKCLYLSGFCFGQLDYAHVIQIAANCPNINRFFLETSVSNHITHRYISPIVDQWQKQLTHIGIPCPSELSVKAYKSIFWQFSILKCQQLQHIYLTDAKHHLLISEQHMLFSTLKHLECITLQVDTETRQMTRSDFCDIRSYLAHHFSWYFENLLDTIHFVNTVLMKKMFVSENHFKELRTVCDFLGVTRKEMSRIVAEIHY